MTIISPLETEALYLAIGPAQLAALVGADYRRIEPGRGGERFLYLKLSQRYAEMIARQWTVPADGAGYVLRLTLPVAFLTQFELSTVAYNEHLEYRVPVECLQALNQQLQGDVEVVTAFQEYESFSVPRGCRPLAALMDRGQV